MNELSEIIITIDTREKAKTNQITTTYYLELGSRQYLLDLPEEIIGSLRHNGYKIIEKQRKNKRVNLVEDWAIKHGAVVQHEALNLCDYKIEGTFRDHEISLGIEAKSYENFLSDSIDEIEDKLIRSFGQYKEVGFFIELGNYSFDVNPDDFHCTLKHSNPNIEPTKALAALEGFCDKMGYAGVHVRQLRGVDQFPYSLAQLLIYILRPHPPRIKLEDYKSWYLNHLMTYPDIGYIRAQELMKRYPNPSWLTTADTTALQEALGKLTGKKLDSYIHNHSLETEDWRNNYFKNGSEIQPCSNCHSKQCKCSKIPSHTATPIQNTTSSKVAGDRRGFSRTPYTPTPPAVTSHSIPKTKGKDPDMDDRQGQVSPPMIDPTADSDIVYHGGYTEIEPNKQSMQDPDLTKTNTHDKPGPATITKSKTTHKMSLKHHLVEWFENPHTLQETIDAYGMKQEAGVGAWSGDRIFNMVVNSEKQGILRSYPHNGTKMYVIAVKPDIDLDIGV